MNTDPQSQPENEHPRRFRVYTNQLTTRILGTVMGVGFLAIGIFSMFFGGDIADAYTKDRADGFGLAATVAGIWAIIVSWADSDLTNVWCRPPNRSRARKLNGNKR